MKNIRTFALILIASIMVGCSSNKHIVYEHDTIYKTNTEYINKIQHDSIYIHDSIVKEIKDDTVVIEKYKYNNIYKFVHDTINSTDTLIKEVNTVVNEPCKKKLTWYDILLNVVFYMVVLLVGYKLYKHFRK